MIDAKDTAGGNERGTFSSTGELGKIVLIGRGLRAYEELFRKNLKAYLEC